MKLTSADLPRVARASRKTLPPKVVEGAVSDLDGSFDFKPHAYTDGTEYETYSEALSAGNLTIREAAHAMGKPANMFRRRVWDANGQKNRKKKGKWLFAVSQRSKPPKGSEAEAPAEPVAA